jgi:hypothetical protein
MIKMTEKLYGYKTSTLSYTDFHYTHPADTILPVEWKNEMFLKNIPVKTQIGSTCVSASGSYGREYLEFLQTGVYEPFSSTFGYVDPDEPIRDGEGMVMKRYLELERKIGIVKRKDFNTFGSYVEIKREYDRLKHVLYDKAKPHRTSYFFYIDSKNINDMKSAIVTFGYVHIGVILYDNFDTQLSASGQVIIPDKSVDKEVGGHAMIIYGWDRYGNWLVRNTWGTEWGNAGNIKLPMMYPIYEAWGIFDGVINNEDMFGLKFGLTYLDRFYETVEGAARAAEMLNKLSVHQPSYKDYKVVKYMNKNVIINGDIYDNYEDAKKNNVMNQLIIPLIYDKKKPDDVLNPAPVIEEPKDKEKWALRYHPRESEKSKNIGDYIVDLIVRSKFTIKGANHSSGYIRLINEPMLKLKTDGWSYDKNLIIKFRNDLIAKGMNNISVVDYNTFTPPANEYLK